MTLDSRSRRIGFIGAGTLGSGLALALYRQGYNVCVVASRTRQSAEHLAAAIPGCVGLESPQDVADAADLVFITTPDSVITPVVASVQWRPGQEVAHCCGASGRELLKPAADQGAETGAFHPFQTFAGMANPDRAAERMVGVTFVVSADGALADFLTALTTNLGGRAVTLKEGQHALYHAAAILNCGYLVTLLQTAQGGLEDCGFSREDALEAVVSLARATLDNISTLGPAASVTGPLVRGDAGTVQQHLEALERSNPPVAQLYGTLTELSLPTAVQRGLEPESEAAIRQAVAEARSHHPPGKR